MDIQPGQANKPKNGSRSPQRRPKAARPIQNGPEPGALSSTGNPVRGPSRQTFGTYEDLSPVDKAFLDAFLDPANPKTYLNATQAYLSMRPNVAYATANREGNRKVDQLRPLIGSISPSRELLEGKLLTVIHLAEKNEDLGNLRGAAMDLAKLLGFLVDKVETREISSDERSALTDLARSSIDPSN